MKPCDMNGKAQTRNKRSMKLLGWQDIFLSSKTSNNKYDSTHVVKYLYGMQFCEVWAISLYNISEQNKG
jgi:hypothetical protein